MARFIPYQASRGFRLSPGSGGIMQPTKETLDALEDGIRWAESECPARLRFYMNELCLHMALVNQGIARKMSFGPSDPSGKATELAWRTPDQGIRRITGAYYLSWKVKQLRPAVWMLYNDSREAYFIEFGISRVGFGGVRNVPERRIRRPVRKLSLIKTIEFAMRSRVYHRVWSSIVLSPQNRYTAHGFSQVVQPASDSHSIFSAWDQLPDIDVGNKSGGTNYGGPMLGRRLP